MSKTRLAIFDVLAILTLMAIARFLPQPGDGALWKTVFDAGHAPLFGLIAVLLLRRFSTTATHRRPGGIGPYRRALVATLILGVGLEATQILGPRDADFVDLLRNTAGVCASLAIALALDRTPHPLNRSRRRRAALLAAASAMLAPVAFPLVSLGMAMRQRDAAMPVLCDFDAGWSRRFWKVHDATVQVIAPPPSWTSAVRRAPRPVERVARLDFQNATYPGFTIAEPARDWSRYENLRFDIYSELDSAVTLVLRIDDAHAYQRYEDRFQSAVVVHPGTNDVRVALANVRAGPKDRVLDLRRVRSVTLFAHRPGRAFSLYVGDFRLE